jgi:hypothetical protein
MMGLFYSIGSGTYSFDILRANADYFATMIVSWYGWLTRKQLNLTHRNWVEIEGPPLTQMRKKIVGTFDDISEPPIDHQDNDPFKRMTTLIILSLRHSSLARSLDDYHACLSKVSPDFYFYAYRAVENIRSHFGTAETDNEKKKAWNAMNKALGREQKDYAELVELARESRHANILGAVIGQDSAQKQLSFVGALIGSFVTYLSALTDASEVDEQKDATKT